MRTEEHTHSVYQYSVSRLYGMVHRVPRIGIISFLEGMESFDFCVDFVNKVSISPFSTIFFFEIWCSVYLLICSANSLMKGKHSIDGACAGAVETAPHQHCRSLLNYFYRIYSCSIS